MKPINVILKILLIFFTNLISLIGQDKYPFTDSPSNNDILAYWYNCPEDSIYWAFNQSKSYLKSYIQVYGRIPDDSFYVNVKAFTTNNLLFERSYFINKSFKNDSISIEYNELFFKITQTVKPKLANPTSIYVEIKSQNKSNSRTINCKYHTVNGQITDFEGNPKKGFILVHPDAFEMDFGVWSDGNGYYQILLPERTYNCFYVNDSFYKVKTLETWSWHMIVDSDRRLNFKIGTGEIYNMNVWVNDGGNSSYFISFRPMVLFPGEKNYNKVISDSNFEIIDMFPELRKSDFKIKINDNTTEIYSVQIFYETGIKTALPSYLLQVKKLAPRIGKQTIQLEFNKKVTIEGKAIEQSAMGYYDLYLNFSGLSKYY